ncbi:MAG: hypothetical protein J6Y28_01340 [Acholeplasmatales bacterium]|nr:hypothetical protein [Acholeplasmatales bacterium]
MFYEFFSEKNTPYFVVVLGIVIIVLVIALFILQFIFQKKLSTKSIDIVSRIETDAITGDECVKMTIANTGFHSIEIRGFGFKHKNRDYDYLRTYKDERNIPVYQKIVISPRDSLETIIDLNDLKAKLNTTKIGKFKAYVIDVYGNYCLINAKDVKAFVELYFKHVEYIEKVRNMPVEKQEKKLKKEHMYEDRKKKILNHTIEDTFEKANIDGKEHKKEEPIAYDATNYAEPVKIIEKEQLEKEEQINSTNNFEDHYETEVNEPSVDEQYEKASENNDFVFGGFSFDDDLSKEISEEVEETEEDENK